jgi:hypothetical protein
MRSLFAATTLIAVTLWASPAQAIPVTYDFDGFANDEIVTSLLAPEGVTLTVTGGQVLTAGLSLNDFEFPPRSGPNVLFDLGPGIGIGFSSAVNSLSGFFTYVAPVTINAFLGATSVGSVSSAFLENTVSSGTPNELISFTGFGLFDRVEIVGDPFGGSFTLDDLTVDVPQQTSSVPEPGTLGLVALGAAALLRRRKTS